MKFRIVGIFISVFIVLSCSSDKIPTPAADHHMHIMSEKTRNILLEQAEGIAKSEIKSMTVDANDAITFLDTTAVDKGVLLSAGFIIGSKMFTFEAEHKRVKSENNYTANQASQFPDRLVALCSVNPLADYAIQEIERCSKMSNIMGLKLNLYPSGVDLRNEKHVKKLSTVFHNAEDFDLPILIHMFTANPDYGSKDAQIFVNQVLSTAPDLPVQIAHMGGGVPPFYTTERVMKVFDKAIDQNPKIMDSDLVFDISASIASPNIIEYYNARSDTSVSEEERQEINDKLIHRIRKLGIERFVYATDWPVLKSTNAYYQILRGHLKEEEVRKLFNNTGPFFDNN
ncbi:amidohydrolase family protein [Aliifodinibius sp. S!AR15-10]|uniref:amidohydrolase family protein n=1 Tax=Aliifodinibius sp. S!AR15-10 TaxID=2950437 RepID=UPI00285F16FC|nr:amidohydrolase family protein [Aliifodinibius sp. S!AR15-10]MDR8394285.1 amidohydrolase family protein [Aliifodinibius sp. S!AR15-10]